MSAFTDAKPGQYICLIRQANQEWSFSCIGDYDTCLHRAQEFSRNNPAGYTAIVQIVTKSAPGPTVWETGVEKRLNQ